MQHPRRRRWYVQYLAADYVYNNTYKKYLMCARDMVFDEKKKTTYAFIIRLLLLCNVNNQIDFPPVI